MRDRFDLEQDIMNCWNVVDDLKLLLRSNDGYDNDDIEAVARLYQKKFEGLWATFEDCCQRAVLGGTRYDNTSSQQTYGVEEEYDTMNDIGFPEPEDS